LITYAAWEGLDRIENMVEIETNKKYGIDKNIK
jgi:hypothetical protein